MKSLDFARSTMTRCATVALSGVLAATLSAQVTNPTQRTTPDPSQPDAGPVFRVTVVSRSISAINYHHRQGSTVVGLVGTAAIPKAKGEARVDSRTGATKVDVNVEKLPPASTLGEGLLTYVMWAITPEGRAENMGELMLEGDHAKIAAATELQAFGIIVTAEPYFAVTQPSDVVVMENLIKPGTTGTISPIDAKYELLPRGTYMSRLPEGDRVTLREAKLKIPLDLMEARQAVTIAKASGAVKYADSSIRKADVDLRNAEAMLHSNGDRKKIQSLARGATQLAEDARIIAVRRSEEERAEAERAAAEQRLNAARTAVEQETRQRELAEAERRSALERERLAKIESGQLERRRRQAEADLAAAAAERAQAEREAQQARLATDAARKDAQAMREQAARDKSQAEAAVRDAEARRQAAEAERAQLRAELLRQLNLVLATRESARGLIVNMSDVLFDTGMATLKPGAREKLAKISGIVLAHPGLKLEVEGHTDSVGGEEYNQRLSESRAKAVRDYLVKESVSPDSISARGFGKTRPVASNDNAAGRQQNRRVELVVSGEPVQTSAGAVSATIPPTHN